MLNDIAYDIGIQNDWLKNGKWTSEEDKQQAYSLAKLEARKYKKGGKIKYEVSRIYYMLTEERKFSKG